MMGGLAARMPFVATVFFIAGLASLGLPGLAGFVAEFTTFIGAYSVLPAGDHPVRVHDRDHGRLHPVAPGYGLLRPATRTTGCCSATPSGVSSVAVGLLAVATLILGVATEYDRA